jgi:GlcNAc-PI de-N-acetylase
MTALYVSPHLDDVAFSCAASLLHRAAKERVIVATVFTEGKGSAGRRAEDRRALPFAQIVHLGFLDAPDRLRIKPGFTSLVLEPHVDRGLTKSIRQALQPLLREADRAYFPLGVGGHIDHRTVFEAHPPHAYFYEERPYTLAAPLRQLRLLELRGGRREIPLETLDRELEPMAQFFEPGERAACVAELKKRLARSHPRRFNLRSTAHRFDQPNARALIDAYSSQHPGEWNPLVERHFRRL